MWGMHVNIWESNQTTPKTKQNKSSNDSNDILVMANSFLIEGEGGGGDCF